MEKSEIQPNTDSYVGILSIHARSGDISTVMREIDGLASRGIALHHLDALKIIETFVDHGHPANIVVLFGRIRRTNQFNDDAASFIFRMLNKHHIDVAIGILEQMYHDVGTLAQGHFIIRHLVKLKRPINELIAACRQLVASGASTRPYVVLMNVIADSNTSEAELLDVLRELRANSVPLTCEHFSGLYRRSADVYKTIRIMRTEFGIKPDARCTRNTITKHMDLTHAEEVVLSLRAAGVPLHAAGQAIVFHCLRNNRLADAANVAAQFRVSLHPRPLGAVLVSALKATEDVENFVRIWTNMHANYAEQEARLGITHHAQIQSIPLFNDSIALAQGISLLIRQPK